MWSFPETTAGQCRVSLAVDTRLFLVQAMAALVISLVTGCGDPRFQEDSRRTLRHSTPQSAVAVGFRVMPQRPLWI